MVTVDCASLPANLVRSELFGREKRAFTGAYARKISDISKFPTPTIFSMKSTRCSWSCKLSF